MSEVSSWASSPAVRASMRSNKGRDTEPELALRRVLHSRGLRYFVNRRPIPSLRRTSDILFPRLCIAVFVDGCFWHGCPEHHTIAKANAAYWADKVQANMLRDRETTEVLERAGWSVIRLWEHIPADDAAEIVIREVDRRRRLWGRQHPRD